jgi:o-succinylbenzoate synthase
LIEKVKPEYLILKPTLLGGLNSTKEWLEIAESNNIKWWLTSMLESNIGLNAIAQFVATLNSSLPQGLGTGQLFNNNIPSPLYLEGPYMKYGSHNAWELPFKL